MASTTFPPSTKYQSLDVYQAGLTPQELSKVRRTLAKRANQRLVRLERAKSSITGEKYSDIGAAPIARDYLSRTGRKRFTEGKWKDSPSSYEEQRREIVQLQAFLSSKTSLVSGIRDIEDKRVKTFESGKWGSAKWTDGDRRALKFASTKEFYDFFQSSVFRELVQSGFTSEQVLEAYDTARERYEGQDEEAIERLSEALEKFREQGKISLKELREMAGGNPLK